MFQSFTSASVTANAELLRPQASSLGSGSATGGPPSPAAVESPMTIASISGCVGPAAAGRGRGASRPTSSLTLPTRWRMPGAV